MAKQLNVNLSMTADTSKAQAQLADLRKTLQNIAKLPGQANSTSLFDDTSLKNASKAALELEQHLLAATNVNTGNLDLSRFSSSLKASNKSLTDYYTTLMKIGPEGQEAFLRIAKSISTAEAPVTRINKQLEEMVVSLKNTARWQISSSILHGFMGTLSSAYGYAKDLNKSLNDIRIVTGQSEEQMAKFAEQANKAAKSLSSTTTAYTNAALIFYQQGLDDDAVQDRTDTVIKMANVTGDSAEEVSSYMTAIWENFADGSKSLEYYADVITRLGADTAASSAEIAEGIESFASIGETIGLSYEYATSALTTIVAKTRASASEVGNGLRTIFSRLQNLSLGETLDDGTDLTKYSKALETVGVSIKDASGELKSMDSILDDLAGKWDTLDQAEKVALANTVGGVRQYTKLISLMDNWDFMKQNIASATNSTGSLQEQADIYAEGWEAARDRVKAAAQAIYQDLLDDKFFITLEKFIAGLLTGIDNTIDNLGGLKGVLLTISSIFLTQYAQRVPAFFTNLKENIMVLTGQAQTLAKNMQVETDANLALMRSDSKVSDKYKIQAEGIARVNAMQQEYTIKAKNMTSAEQQAYQAKIQNVQRLYEEVAALNDVKKALEETEAAAAKAAATSAQTGLGEAFASVHNAAMKTSSASKSLDQAKDAAKDASKNESDPSKIQAYDEMIVKLGIDLAAAKDAQTTQEESLDSLLKTYGLTKEQIDELVHSQGNYIQVIKDNKDIQESITKKIQETTNKYKTYILQCKQLSSLKMSKQADDWKKNASEIGKSAAATAGLRNNMSAYLTEIQKVAKQNGIAFSGDVSNKLKVISDMLTNGGYSAEQYADKFKEFFDTMKNDSNGLSAVLTKLEQDIQACEQEMTSMKMDPETFKQWRTAIEEAAQGTDNLTEAERRAKQLSQEHIQSVANFTTGMTQFASSIMSVYTLMTSINNATTTFTDSSATALEKVGAAISVLMGITSAFSAVMAFGSTISKTSIADKLKEVAASKLASYAKAQETGTTTFLTGAQIALNTAMEANPIGVILVAVIALIAALTALALIIYKVVTAESEEEKAVKKTAVAYENAKKAANETKEAYDSITSDLSAYDDLIDKLNQCTKGTEEWANAFGEVHTKILEILDKYPELLEQDNLYNDDGTLNQDVLNKFQAKYEMAKDSSAYAAALAKADNAEATVNQMKAELRDNVSMANYSAYAQKDNGDGTYSGLDFTSEVNQALMDNAEELANLDAEQFKVKVKEIAESVLPEGYEFTALNTFAENLVDLQGDFNELSQSAKSASTVLTNTGKMIASEYYGKNGKTDASVEETNLLGNQYTNKYNEEKQNILKLSDSWSKSDSTNDEVEALWAEYQKAIGVDYELDKNAIRHNDENRTLAYKNTDGDVEEIDIESVANEVAAFRALNDLGTAADNVTKILSNLNINAIKLDNSLGTGANGKGISEGLKTWISSGNFESMSGQDFKAMQSEILKTEGGTEGYLQQIFGENDSAKLAQDLGFKSAEEMIAAFDKGLNNASTAWDNIEVPDGLSEKLSSNLSVQAAEGIQAAVKELDLGPLGEEGGKAYVNGLNLALSKVDDKDISTALNIMNNTDWTDSESIANTVDQLNDLGAEIDVDSNAWKAFTEAAKDASGSLQDFSDLKSNISVVFDKTDAKAGDEISTEDYEKLLASGLFENLDQHVIQVDDDTVKLTEDLSNLASQDLNDLYSQMNNYAALQQAVKDNADVMSAISDMSAEDASVETLRDNLQSLWDTKDGEQLLAQVGYTDDRLKELCESGTQEDLQRLTELVQNFLGADFDTSALQEQLANSAEDFDELQEMLNNESISIEAFNKAWESMRNELDEDIDADRVKDVTDQIQDMAEASDELADSLKDDDKEAKKIAAQLERYNSAVEDVVDNYDDWLAALKDISKSGGTILDPDLLKEIGNAMSDMLNIDADSLSTEFLSNAENLQLMKEAAEGSTDAYEKLRQAAQEDILAHCEIVNEEEFQTALANLNNQIDTINLKDIEIGADLYGYENFISACEDMINAAGMTAQQATDYLSSMGVDAEVETVPSEQTDTHQYTSVKSSVTPTYFWGTDPATGNRMRYSFPNVQTEIIPVEESTTSTTTATALKVTSAKKSSGGNFKINNNKSSNAKSNSGKRSSGGGGGSSKPQEHNNEDYKDPTDEKDRYHVIKNQLEDLTSQYDRISKAKDKAFGSARLANLNKEIAAQKKLTQANKQYLDEIESYLAQDKGTMSSYGAIFDNNGTILNYDELVKQQVDAYNRAVDTFNAAYTDDEGAKTAFEAAQDVYDKFQDALSQYEETQDLFNEQTQTYIDSLNAERELLLERTQLQVELKVNVEEDALNFLQYALDNIENKAYDCAEAFGYLNDMTAAYLGTAKAYEEGLRSLFVNQRLSDADFDNFVNGNSATFSTISQMLSNGESAGFQSEDVETIRDYVKELISANENLQEVRQTVHDQILTVWDEWNEKLDDGISKLEHLQAIQESYVNIIDIVGQKNLGVSNAFMRSLSQQGINQANDKLVAEKARYDALKKARDDAYATFEEQKNKGILSEEEIKMWEDSLHQMDEDVRSASEDFQSAWEDALTSINEAFEAEVDRIIEAYDDAAAGLMGSMSQLQEAFDRKSDLADQYLDDYEKIYQFSKLNRDIENSIDSTSNVKAKKELLELQSKINAYEEAGTEISEYQMQQLQQEYELKKAQIELEEASDAKSQVKMQRDSEGNYSYVYTANSDDVAKAEQNYEDKLHAMQQSNAEYINDLQSNMIQMEQDYQDKVKEIMTDTSLTAEERMAQLNELNDYYDEKMKFYISEAQLWEQNSQTLYEKDWMNYATMTGYKISEEDKWLDHWNETQLALLTGFDTLEDYQTNHNMNVANLLLASGEAFSTWQANIEEAMNNAGTSLGTFEEDATDAMKTVAEESEKTKDQIKNDSKDMVDAVNDVVAAVANWETQYSKIVQDMLSRNKALVQSFNSLIAAWSKFEAAENAHNSSSGNDNSSGSGSGSSTGSGDGSGSSGSGSGSGSGADNSDKIEGVAAAIWMDGSAAGWGNGSTRRQRLQEKGVLGAQDYINAHASNGDIYSAWASKRGQLRQFYYGSFDTGGYTGEWGLDGKLALLHEKELVLNADDTTNFLKAIDVVRQISDMIDLNALSSAGGLSSLFAATASSSSQNLQQEVHITAEFPNATDKDQISEAFSDLVNLASQYANRK